MSATQITVSTLIGLVFIVLGWGLAALFIDRDVRRWQIAFLVRRVGLYGTALRGAGIPVPDDDEMPDRAPTWRERHRGRREPVDVPAAELVPLEPAVTQPEMPAVRDLPPTQPIRRPTPHPRPESLPGPSTEPVSAVMERWYAEQTAKFDADIAEWRANLEEQK